MRTRIPKHLGVIPDGNRRWSVARGGAKKDGYAAGVAPGLRLAAACRKLGIPELSVYGFTQDNVKRPAEQVRAFQKACVEIARRLTAEGASVRAVGDARSRSFPRALRPFLKPRAGDFRVNLLVNYGWRWDLDTKSTRDIPQMDLIVRWGGRRRLSGFLPAQSVYADIYVVDELWPDFAETQLDEAVRWYARQDRTLGG